MNYNDTHEDETIVMIIILRGHEATSIMFKIVYLDKLHRVVWRIRLYGLQLQKICSLEVSEGQLINYNLIETMTRRIVKVVTAFGNTLVTSKQRFSSSSWSEYI